MLGLKSIKAQGQYEEYLELIDCKENTEEENVL